MPGQRPSMAASTAMILNVLWMGSPVVTDTECCPSAAPLQPPRTFGTTSESAACIIPAAWAGRVRTCPFL